MTGETCEQQYFKMTGESLRRPSWDTNGIDFNHPILKKYLDYFSDDDKEARQIAEYILREDRGDAYTLTKKVEDEFWIDGNDEVCELLGNVTFDKIRLREEKVKKWIEELDLKIPPDILGMDTNFGKIERIFPNSYQVVVESGKVINYEKIKIKND